MKLPPDLVLFDCDGVLVDSEGVTTEVMRDNLKRYGLDIPIGQINDMFVGGTMLGVEITARGMGADLPEDWLDEIYGEMFDRLGKEVELIPGIAWVLDVLDAAGIAYAVCSNGPHAKMNITLGRTGLLDRFQGRIISREDVAAPKPAPDVYLLAAKQAGVKPRSCVVVEDSASGARAGRAAKMRVFGFAADTSPDKLAPHCHALFADMRDLPRLLRLID